LTDEEFEILTIEAYKFLREFWYNGGRADTRLSIDEWHSICGAMVLYTEKKVNEDEHKRTQDVVG